MSRREHVKPKQMIRLEQSLLTSCFFLPVHVVHPIRCEVEALDLGVTRFKGTGQKQSERFEQANLYS